MTIKYLTAKDVLFYHDIILKDTVEDQGIAPHTSIESALHRIDHHITYDDLDDIYEIAALYGVAIAKGHCFNNGNKRTALVSMLSFLLINNIEIDVGNDIIEELMVEIATDQMDRMQVTAWLKKYTKSWTS